MSAFVGDGRTNGYSLSLPYSYAVIAIGTGTPQVPNNTVFNVMYQTMAGPTQGPAVQAIKDTCVAAPSITNPTGTVDIPRNSSFTWTPQATGYSSPQYTAQLALDSNFTNIVTSGRAGGTVWIPGEAFLQPGVTYYTRVAVAQTFPWASKWSKGVKFSVQLTEPNFDLAGSPGTQLQPARAPLTCP